MSEKFRRRVTILWVVLVALFGAGPAVVLTCLWGQIPDEVPAHWGLGPEPNRWGSKLELAFMPALCLILGVGFIVALLVIARQEGRGLGEVLCESTRSVVRRFKWVVMLATFASIELSWLALVLVEGTSALVMLAVPLGVAVLGMVPLVVYAGPRVLLSNYY